MKEFINKTSKKTGFASGTLIHIGEKKLKTAEFPFFIMMQPTPKRKWSSRLKTAYHLKTARL
jgi:hypothetical protein